MDAIVKNQDFDRLPPHAKRWLVDRISAAQEKPALATNPGALRCAQAGPHEKHRTCVGGLAVYDSIEEGAAELVRLARRAGVEPGDAAAPAIVLRRARRVAVTPSTIVGWAPGLGPSDAEITSYKQLRADWEAFERAGVGTRILPALKADLDAWRKFRDEYETNSESWLGYTTNEFTGMINAEIMRANRVRKELADYKPSSPAPTQLKADLAPSATPPTAPAMNPADKAKHAGDDAKKWLVDLNLPKEEIIGHDVEVTHPNAAAVNTWVQQHPLYDAITDPAKPADTFSMLNAVVNPFARPPGTPWWPPKNTTPLYIAGGLAVAWAVYRIAVDVVVPIRTGQAAAP